MKEQIHTHTVPVNFGEGRLSRFAHSCLLFESIFTLGRKLVGGFNHTKGATVPSETIGRKVFFHYNFTSVTFSSGNHVMCDPLSNSIITHEEFTHGANCHFGIHFM